MDNENSKSYYTTGQVANIVEVNAATIFRWCEKGKLPGANKVCGRWRISKTEFHRWCDERGISYGEPHGTDELS
jgi:excisionase family DNA binding protein